MATYILIGIGVIALGMLYAIVQELAGIRAKLNEFEFHEPLRVVQQKDLDLKEDLKWVDAGLDPRQRPGYKG